MTFQPQHYQSIDVDSLTNDATMDFPRCIVCSFDIVDEGYTWECGHATHKNCFPVFLELTNIHCDVRATAQWYYGNGHDMATEEWTEDYPQDQYPYEEEPRYDQDQYWDYQEGDYAEGYGDEQWSQNRQTNAGGIHGVANARRTRSIRHNRPAAGPQAKSNTAA